MNKLTNVPHFTSCSQDVRVNVLFILFSPYDRAVEREHK